MDNAQLLCHRDFGGNTFLLGGEMKRQLDRRQLLKAGAGAMGTMGALLATRPSQAAVTGPRFLIVLTATGGASIIDSLLAIRRSECSQPDRLNCFTDQHVKTIRNSPFRAVDLDLSAVGPIDVPVTAHQSSLIDALKQDLLVATHTGTSVTHAVAQRRSVTGNEAWAGRTLQEIVSQTYGQGFAMPNVHLSVGTSFTERGQDHSLNPRAFGEVVASPKLWPLSLHGAKGGATQISLQDLSSARAFRDQELEATGNFGKVFKDSSKLKHWRQLRQERIPEVEKANLIEKLMFVPDSSAWPLEKAGLKASADAPKLQTIFPNIDEDPLEAQAALAFLLIKNKVSVSVTLGPNFEARLRSDAGSSGALVEGDLVNPPLGFDFSHTAHRATQAMMWKRILSTVSRLAQLLKEEQYAPGQSFWDRTLIYVATDFGRSKNRPVAATEWSSGHHLNNGSVLLSPLLKGNRLLGGVNPETGLTYGYDPHTGAPRPQTEMEEKYLFAGILQTLGVDTSKTMLPQVPCFYS